MLLSPSKNLKKENGKKLFTWWNQETPFGALRRSITSRSPISRPGITWMRQIESIPRTDLNCGWKRSNLHPKLNTPPPLRILYFSLLYNHSIKKETNAPCPEGALEPWKLILIYPLPLWWGRVRVGVDIQVLSPLTSILSHRGERRYLGCYFLHNIG